MTRHVPPENSPTLPFWLIGEAPGATEEREGRPFVGRAGRVLDLLLQAAGIRRDHCHLRNVVNVRPLNNDFSIYYEDKKRTKPTVNLGYYRSFLRQDIEKHKPRIIVCLGAEAMKAVFPHLYDVTNHRGSIYQFNTDTRIIITLHPSFVNHVWTWFKVVEMDLRKAKRELDNPQPLPQSETHVIKTLEDLYEWADTLLNADRMAVDIETYGSTLSCIGFSHEPNIGVTIPILRCPPQDDFHGAFWGRGDEKTVLGVIAEILASPSRKIFQNACYDLTWLENKYGLPVANFHLDTMLAQHVLFPELGAMGKIKGQDKEPGSGAKSLAFLTSLYTRYPYHKDLGKTGSMKDLWTYNALDCITTLLCADVLEPLLHKKKLWRFYYEHEHSFVRPVCEMTWKGITLDPERRKRASEQLHKDSEDIIRNLSKFAGREINLKSPKQVGELLYVDLELPPQHNRKAKTKAPTTNKIALEKLYRKFPDLPELMMIRDFRSKQTLLADFINKELGPDGKFHTAYNIAGTLTGRWASTRSFLGGGNLQNRPKGLCRSVVVPDYPGYSFTRVDLSAADVRVLAWMSRDPVFIAFFESEGGKIHDFVAASYLKCNIEDVPPKERQIFKKVVHGTNYGASARTVAINAGINVRRAEDGMSFYKRRFPGVLHYQKWVRDQIKATRTLSTPLGRVRTFLDRMNDDLYRKAYAWIPSSTVADWINVGLLYTYYVLPDDCRIVFQTHDDFGVQHPDERTEEVREIIGNSLDFTVDVFGSDLFIPYEMKTGKDWDEVS